MGGGGGGVTSPERQVHFSICLCHPFARALRLFGMIPEENPLRASPTSGLVTLGCWLLLRNLN